MKDALDTPSPISLVLIDTSGKLSVGSGVPLATKMNYPGNKDGPGSSAQLLVFGTAKNPSAEGMGCTGNGGGDQG